ncbi:hypothetical protein SteCoe_25410 [Stentor coeruleus]|uniref:Uncharacterized protein n=1 Tax=Stentor coeruleus TaxID=5963 RepID=A0A1R2BF98_9CILI|nr:hypothetical protein SteCoe_25410 [Stentor coeruleus]
MGCAATKDEINKEEHCIILGEESLSYTTKNCKDVDNIHRKYSFSGNVNNLQFSEISKRLYLAIYVSPSEKIRNFYNFFKTDEENYSLFSLLVLGLLVSSGNPIDKARILFEIEDKLSGKILSRESVQNLAKEMITISVDYLPSLFLTNEEYKVNEDSVKEYLSKIKQNKDKALGLMTKEFMGGEAKEIKLVDFLNNFRVDETAKLLRPHFIRKFVLQNMKTMEELTGSN